MKSIWSKKWKEPLVVTVMIMLLLGVIVGFLFRDSYFFYEFGKFAFLHVQMPALFIVGIWAIIKKYQERKISLVPKAFVTVLPATACAIGISLGISLGICYLMQKMEVIYEFGNFVFLHILMPALLIAGIWAIISKCLKRKISLESKSLVTVLTAMVCSSGISLGVGYLVQKMEMENAYDYVFIVAPLLEDYRQEHGQYPETIKKVQELRSPKLFTKSLNYSSSDEHFRFSYEDGKLRAFGKAEWSFDSRSPGWSLFHSDSSSNFHLNVP